MKMTSAIQAGKRPSFGKLQLATALAAVVFLAGCATAPPPPAQSQQQSITPAQALGKLERGNARFAAGKSLRRDWPRQRAATTGGQYPFAVVLSCIDSRASSEIIFDQGLGDIFSARVAGNVLDDEILGSLEFACKIAGAKLIAVVGHTHCGAVKGACSGAQLGHLTGLLDKIQLSVAAAKEKQPDIAVTDGKFVEEVAELNVQGVVKQIHEQSPLLRELIDSGRVGIVGGIYNLDSGMVHFLIH